MSNPTSFKTFEALNRLRSATKRASESNERHSVPRTRTPDSVNSVEVTAKVIEDIHFLRDRIDHIKRSNYPSPNPTILQTYQSMLESRESVLNWLQDNDAVDKRAKNA